MSLRGALVVSIAVMAAIVWADDRGIRPRPTPNDYPDRQTIDGVTLAAAVLSPEQVKRRFSTDLNRGYIVVEVAVFPESGHEIELAARDFLARFGTDSSTERPVTAEVIAARLGKKDPPPPSTTSGPGPLDKVHVYTVERIGYEKGPYGRSGVYTDTQVAVGIGDTPAPPPQPAPTHSSGMSHHDVRQELEGMALPERRISEEMAGYLYFDKPAKGKSPMHLTYYGSQGKVELTLPVPAK